MHIAIPTTIAGSANRTVVMRQPQRLMRIAANSGMSAVPTFPAVKCAASAVPKCLR